jgi:predicted dinucleotide-binding enzyme
MTTLGVIGSGYIGATVARLAIAAGYQVVLSNSRGPQTLRDLVADLGSRARAGTAQEAAAAGDIVVVAIPVKAVPALPGEALAGKVVIDTGNYYPARDGQIAELDTKQLTVSDYTQRSIPDALVVKGFNNIFFKHLASLPRPAGAADRSYLPIAGDSAAAKAAVQGFLDEIGYGAVAYGALSDSWRQEAGTPVYGAPYGPFEDEKGHPAGEPVIRAALAAATRS